MLVFLPGMREIEKLAGTLRDTGLPLFLVPLHSTLSADAQLQVL